MRRAPRLENRELPPLGRSVIVTWTSSWPASFLAALRPAKPPPDHDHLLLSGSEVGILDEYRSAVFRFTTLIGLKRHHGFGR